jgi:hypothetical protein
MHRSSFGVVVAISVCQPPIPPLGDVWSIVAGNVDYGNIARGNHRVHRREET